MVHFFYAKDHKRGPDTPSKPRDATNTAMVSAHIPKHIFPSQLFLCSSDADHDSHPHWVPGYNTFSKNWPAELERYNLRGDRTLLGPDSIIERFFQWDAGATDAQRSTWQVEAWETMETAGMVELIYHQGSDYNDNGSKTTFQCFVEKEIHGGFDKVNYHAGIGRTAELEVKACVILKCAQHGHSWEVNVLG